MNNSHHSAISQDQGEGQVRSVIQDQGEVANQEQGADDIKVSLAEVEAEGAFTSSKTSFHVVSNGVIVETLSIFLTH